MTDNLREALERLEQAEANYRIVYQQNGGGHLRTGRAWDLMRRAGDAARAALAATAEREVDGEADAWAWLETGHERPADRDYSADEMVDAFLAGRGLATPQPEPLTGAVERAREEGPQRVVTPDKFTCTGCKHLQKKAWDFEGENDDHDSGIDASCGAFFDGANPKHIDSYWQEGQASPGWCPLAALKSSAPIGYDEGVEAAAKLIENGWVNLPSRNRRYEGPGISKLPTAIRALSQEAHPRGR